MKIILAGGLVFGLSFILVPRLAQGQAGGMSVAGRVLDPQNSPLAGATIEVTDGSGTLLAEAESQEDGTFVADLEESADELVVVVSRPHFGEASFEFDADEVDELMEGEALRLPDVTLDRQITAGFWVATLAFVLALLLIALERLHNTTAALLGVGIVFLSSFILTPLWPDLYIYNFERALTYIDFEVIFLVMGMMVVIGIIEGTGIFQWLTYMAYRLSRGRVEILVVILMLITSVASALLDNVTTMLLMTPITLQIGLALGINPLSLLLPEVLASNVGGISTLVGTPTNIMIGSFANISFNDFVVNLTPGVLLSLVALIIYVEWLYRKEYKAAAAGVSPVLAQKLAEDAKIKDKGTLIKSGIVFAGMLALFITGERFHLVPAVTALMGATAMLLWVDLDVERMLRTVDWTTLVFFMALFMLVGAVREVGLVGILADGIALLIGGQLARGMLILVWMGALLSMVIANIPFTAAMLPVVGFLTRTVPGAESKALFYSLSVGSAMGGNGSLIGASANVVTAGISERAGYPITFVHFLKVGFPAMLVTVAVGMIWLLIRFL
jgi:Na+/H+ antiporter NhaD/arsenite permease-like protein